MGLASQGQLAIANYIIMTENKQTWDKIMTTVIVNYNDTPNTALSGITPNEVYLQANQGIIFQNQSTKTKRKTRRK